jgi:hypothetical protein
MLFHALFVAYAIGAFIGYRNGVVDILAGVRGRVRDFDVPDS